tara:strand:- start:367 stop:525 length:159 start_codon:yes stop_codon:yes gene_type:complete
MDLRIRGAFFKIAAMTKATIADGTSCNHHHISVTLFMNESIRVYPAKAIDRI